MEKLPEMPETFMMGKSEEERIMGWRVLFKLMKPNVIEKLMKSLEFDPSEYVEWD